MTTTDEKRVLDALASAWNVFISLPQQDPSDRDEFMRAIHAAQQIVACRVAQRADPEIWPTYPRKPAGPPNRTIREGEQPRRGVMPPDSGGTWARKPR